RQVFQRQLEEQRLARLAFRDLLADRAVVGRAVLDRVVEDGRVAAEARDRELSDVTLERSAVEEIAGDVVEPEALSPVVERVGRFHLVTSVLRLVVGEACASHRWIAGSDRSCSYPTTLRLAVPSRK